MRRNERQETRKKEYKKAIDIDDFRKKREDSTSELRKSKRDESLLKKRNVVSEDQENQETYWTPVHIQQQLDQLPQYVSGVMSNDPTGWFQHTVNIRKLLSIEKNPPIEQILKTGCVARFVQFLTVNDNPKLQFEAAWVLTNIASGSSEQTQAVVKYGAVPAFISLVFNENDELKEQAIWALGNIAGDSARTRDLILQHNLLQPLLHILNSSDKPSLLRNATWTLSNLCRGKPQPDFTLVSQGLPTLSRLIHSPDEEVVVDACWALSYLSDGSDGQIQAVLNSGVGPRLIQLMKQSNYTIQTPALRTTGNIVTGNDEQTQGMIDMGILPVLYTLLQSPRKSIKKEAAWTVSNITAGNHQQTQLVINANIVPLVIYLLEHGEFEVKREAAWAISNAVSWKIPEQVKYIVTAGAIPPVVDLLRSTDTRMIIVALDTLKHILGVGQTLAKNGENPWVELVEEVDGGECLEELQNHENHDVYKRAVHILEHYFGGEEEDENMAPNVANNQFTFQPQFSVPSGGFVF